MAGYGAIYLSPELVAAKVRYPPIPVVVGTDEYSVVR
jgi:hypothetical protein